MDTEGFEGDGCSSSETLRVLLPFLPLLFPFFVCCPGPALACRLRAGADRGGLSQQQALNGVGGEGRARARLMITFPFPIRTNSDSALHTSVMNPNPQDAYLGPSQGAPPPGRRSGECPPPSAPRFPQQDPAASHLHPAASGPPLGPLPPLESFGGGTRHTTWSPVLPQQGHAAAPPPFPPLLHGAGQCPPCPRVLPLTVASSLAGFLDGDADSKGERLLAPGSVAPSPARTRVRRPSPPSALQSAKSRGSGWEAAGRWPGTPLCGGVGL